MRQIMQDMGSGATYVADAPTPIANSGGILVETTTSLISAGTERMLVDFGRASLLQKARKQPERVKQMIEKARTDGVLNTIDAVRSKLAQPIPLGYCNVGVVRSVGQRVSDLAPGDRVVSNGPHADVVNVLENLCARIPDNVDDESAAFTVVASIGLQGIRLAEPTLGEAVVVIGTGLIGLLTVQLLRAQGCRVLAVDFDQAKLDLAKTFGAEICNPALGHDPVAAGIAFSRGRGADAVIITASTSTSDPVTQAAKMSRKRGRIVLVGVTGLELNRADFYEKELSFSVSCSYGPGRYDPSYEQAGNDYPIGFVRWTAQRNFEAILDMMGEGALNVRPLISHRIAFEDAPSAYDTLAGDKAALGLLLTYGSGPKASFERTLPLAPERSAATGSAQLGFIGAGNYASRMLIPAFRKAGAQLSTIVANSGTSSVVHGRPAGFAQASTDVDVLLKDSQTNAVAIVTRHDSHADLVQRALAAGKHVFVEKPLALTLTDLEAVEKAYDLAADRLLMIGFNRRFAPHVVKMKQLLDGIQEPKSFIFTMNAGAIPASHWTQDLQIGGGRIIGEACHHIDLMRFLAGAPIVSVTARGIGAPAGVTPTEDKAVITLGFADGSFGTVNYLANGAASFPKERIEAFAGGRILALDNFRSLKGYGVPGFRKLGAWTQDKGQNGCAAAFLRAITTGDQAPIPAQEIFEVTRVTIEAAEQLRQQK
ncbi:bi-domain-containing oxidoreductase [Devosia sp.]|uniref:bi-domain-containing oxidoreductase n=1 Tax=Devosia sp. TaxID=1871048 RepID=UPI0025BDC8EF|nr:bi-domain-containing oxidoreductase [Devosia sp.]